MYTVQYRCLYRDFWYDAEGVGDFTEWAAAVRYCNTLRVSIGRLCRVVDAHGNVLYSV
jgi:uncharacterized protein YcfL